MQEGLLSEAADLPAGGCVPLDFSQAVLCDLQVRDENAENDEDLSVPSLASLDGDGEYAWLRCPCSVRTSLLMGL